MTATRDDRGRFVSADEYAANRLLNKAVAQAIQMIRDGDRHEVKRFGGEVVRTVYVYNRPAVVTMLAEAGRSAELLLDGGAK